VYFVTEGCRCLCAFFVRRFNGGDAKAFTQLSHREKVGITTPRTTSRDHQRWRKPWSVAKNTLAAEGGHDFEATPNTGSFQDVNLRVAPDQIRFTYIVALPPVVEESSANVI
jgi:hypothetical protein